MNFDNEKGQALCKIDKSKKKSIDAGVKEIVSAINKKENYYTTSSCSGRVILISIPPGGKRHDVEWLYAEHGRASFPGLKKALANAKGDVWINQEAAIFHVCSRSIEDAIRLLNAARDSGFKRSGIITANKRIITEIVSTEMISAILAKGGKQLVDGNYLKILVKEANARMKRNREKIEEFYDKIKRI